MNGFDKALGLELVDAGERFARARGRRGAYRRRLLAGVAVFSVTGVAAASASLTLLGQSRSDASKQLTEELSHRTRVDLATVPADQRNALAALASTRDQSVEERGWAISPGVSAFALSNGDLCVVSANGSSCAAGDDVAPAIAFGYHPETKATFLQVIVPADTKGLEAETSDGSRVALSPVAGVVEQSVPGKVVRLHWLDGDRPVAQDIAIELSADAN